MPFLGGTGWRGGHKPFLLASCNSICSGAWDSFRDLITDSSMNTNLLTKFNSAVTQQKVLEKYFQCVANVESIKPENTCEENRLYNNFTCAFLCLFLSLGSWDPPL